MPTPKVELNPCPFCQSEAQLERISFFGFWPEYAVECTNLKCGASSGFVGSPFYGKGRNEIEAINYWNGADTNLKSVSSTEKKGEGV